jgi:hypothetical protein
MRWWPAHRPRIHSIVNLQARPCHVFWPAWAARLIWGMGCSGNEGWCGWFHRHSQQQTALGNPDYLPAVGGSGIPGAAVSGGPSICSYAEISGCELIRAHVVSSYPPHCQALISVVGCVETFHVHFHTPTTSWSTAIALVSALGNASRWIELNLGVDKAKVAVTYPDLFGLAGITCKKGSPPR